MNTGGYSSSENHYHHHTILSQNAVTQGISEALDNLAGSGAIGEDEVGTDSED